jgi:hypothetical protein
MTGSKLTGGGEVGKVPDLRGKDDTLDRGAVGYDS